MATSFEVPSFTDLPNLSAPRRFTTSGDVSYVSVRLFDKERPELGDTEDMVYRDGIFCSRYRSNSTRVGNTFTIVRDGGWSKDLELHVEPVSAIPAPITAQLTPTEYSPWAQWALDSGAPGGGVVQWDTTDRSGSGHPGGGANYIPFPDIRGGAHTAAAGTFATATGPYLSGDSATMNGELTLCGRACLPYRNAGVFQALLSADGCRLSGINAGGYFSSQHYQGSLNVSSLYVPDSMLGQWFWWSLRRSADRQTLRFQFEETFETITGASPGNPVYNRFNIGGNLSFGGETWRGLIADLSIWTTQRSDADMLRYRKISLGLP